MDFEDDDFDVAFDALFSEGDESSEGANEETFEFQVESASDSSAEDELKNLQEALAQDALPIVQELGVLLDQAPRKATLAALYGASERLSQVAQGDLQELTQALLQSLQTRRGTIRKVLRSEQHRLLVEHLQALPQRGEILPAAELKTYLQMLQSSPDMDSKAIAALFQAGLSSGGQLEKARASDIGPVTGISPAEVTQLQATWVAKRASG